MALFRAHEVVNLSAMAGFLYFVPREFFIPFVFGYLFGTFLLSPDIDLKHSKPSKRWGILRHIWKPYRKLSRHRGSSHVPFLGSFLRVSYIMLLLMIFFYVLKRWFSFDFSLSHLPDFLYDWAFFAFLGICLSELMHVALDLLWSSLRKIF
ncbi:MAG: DUF2227 family putative metal-binding protein [Aquificaceae bacterium]